MESSWPTLSTFPTWTTIYDEENFELLVKWMEMILVLTRGWIPFVKYDSTNEKLQRRGFGRVRPYFWKFTLDSLNHFGSNTDREKGQKPIKIRMLSSFILYEDDALSLGLVFTSSSDDGWKDERNADEVPEDF